MTIKWPSPQNYRAAHFTLRARSESLEVAQRQNLFRIGPISRATDSARRFERHQLVTKSPVQLLDPWCRLIRKHDGAAVFCQPLRCADLFIPTEAAF